MADEIRAQPRNQLLGLLGAIQDEQFRADVGGGLRDVLNRGLLGGLLGMPVDLATMAMRPLGYKTENPVGGSEWIGQKMQDAGLVSAKRNPVGETLAGLVDPATMAAGAIKAVPMAAGMFIGKGAKTWDALQASKAMELEKAGTPARQIWSETGTWKGPDGKWRQEIPDNTSKLTLGNQPLDAYGAQEANLFSAVKHGNLRRAYPELDSTKMLHYPSEQYMGANFDPTENVITLGKTAMDNKSGAAQHEIQHIIQDKEGFARGGSSASFPGGQSVQDAQLIRNLTDKGMKPSEAATWFTDKLGRNPSNEVMDLSFHPDLAKMGSPEQSYRRLAGEAEARATQARIPMDAAQRRATFPEDSYDVPMNALIVRGLLAQ